MTLSNKEVMQRIFDAGTRGDQETLQRYIHEDIIINQAKSMPYGGIYRGISGLLALRNKVMSDTWKDAELICHHILEEDDVVVLVTTFKAGIKGSDKTVEMPLIEFWRFKDGKAIENIPIYHDTKLLHDLYFNN